MDEPMNDLTLATTVQPVERKAVEGAVRDVAHGVEKFNAADLNTLRSELLQSGVDSFQAAEIVTSFLTGRGYGCSPAEARSVASSIEFRGATEERIQAALENVARVM